MRIGYRLHGVTVDVYPRIPPSRFASAARQTLRAALTLLLLLGVLSGQARAFILPEANGVVFAFRDNGDGTVTDLNTGLTWQQTDDGNTRGWAAACTYCTQLRLNGHADWRAPSPLEMATIRSYSGSLIPMHYFPTSRIGGYWTNAASYVSGRENFSYYLNTSTNAIDDAVYNDAPFYIRCVRGPALTPQFSGYADSATGLTWNFVGVAYSYNSAVNAWINYYASQWRMPTPHELLTLRALHLSSYLGGGYWAGALRNGQPWSYVPTKGHLLYQNSNTSIYTDSVYAYLALVQGGPSCDYAISKTSQDADAASGDYSVFVISGGTGTCNWSAFSDSPWARVDAGATGTGSGQVLVHVDANASANPRTATFNIAGETYTLTQSGYVPATLTVAITPAAAATAGARWRMDGGAWQTGGTQFASVADGQHTIEFNQVGGWTTPQSQTFTASSGLALQLTGDYAAQLTVNIAPQAAVTAGAQWRVDGGSWQLPGAHVSGLGAGQHTLEFSAVPGWKAPAAQAFTFQAGQPQTLAGTYRKNVPNLGLLQLLLNN
ncbi:DUF1566 domain-containing protein [Fundidesulfovibrio soli]|uniref:Lcl domain-containing protein n=1 Tax=Fundidesulfovibrio soli TaxID=2922716 RepID=UPI001FAF1F00|nr:DUF1566 domain-containing protein [Fundidesulfovibrio soli]